MNREQYAAYRQSKAWKKRRMVCMMRDGYRCQMCGCTWARRPIDAHHLHYRNVGNEQEEDLIALCSRHHQLIHNQSDGYNVTVFRRLKESCREDNWGDPVPEWGEEHERYQDGYFGELAELLRQMERGEIVDNADLEEARRGLSVRVSTIDESLWEQDRRMLGIEESAFQRNVRVR